MLTTLHPSSVSTMKTSRPRSMSSKLMPALFQAMLFQTMVLHAMARNLQGVEDQKTYYPPDPHHSTPSVPTTPSHGSPTPSYGSSGGGSGNCGTPPSHHGGGHHGGGGYYGSPPTTPTTPTINPPTVPVTPTPSLSPPVVIDPGTPPYTPSTPSTPPLLPSPTTPPLLPSPTTPPYIDPNNIPPIITGTCNFWRTNPNLIWNIFGYWGTVGPVFGLTTTPAFTPGLSLLQALANTRTDGYGALYREGTASLLNSLGTRNFSYTTQQVKDRFSASLVSDKAAAAQARVFKQANEGKLKLIKP